MSATAATATTTKQAIRNIWAKVHSATGFPFPKTVAALSDLHVIRYHVDYTGCTATSYIHDLASDSVAVDIASIPSDSDPSVREAASRTWDVSALKAALQKVQQGKSSYPEFADEIVRAGTVGYMAFIEGKRVLYYGEKGTRMLSGFLERKTWIEGGRRPS